MIWTPPILVRVHMITPCVHLYRQKYVRDTTGIGDLENNSIRYWLRGDARLRLASGGAALMG